MAGEPMRCEAAIPSNFTFQTFVTRTGTQNSSRELHQQVRRGQALDSHRSCRRAWAMRHISIILSDGQGMNTGIGDRSCPELDPRVAGEAARALSELPTFR
jgi:hypothetical protein